MRLFAALGPGNIVEAHRNQTNNVRIVSETSIIFSGQLFEYCRERGIEALFTSHHPSADEIETPPVKLINIPRPWERAAGWRFHIGRVIHALRLARLARAFRADLALIDSGTVHYFALSLLPLLGVPVAVNFHNVRWPQGFEPRGRLARIIRVLDSWFFRKVAVGAIGCSPECGVQARGDGAGKLPYFGWYGQFHTEGFTAGEIDPVRDPFRLLFVGRIERYKGVFDLIPISRLLRQRCRVPICIEICGDGGALTELGAALETSGEADRIVLRGRLQRAELLDAYRRAHAVVVPTRGDFCEGMPLVCAEAMLSGRPVVTSRLSNALPILNEAIAEVEPEDVASYAGAIGRLAEDREYYERLFRACPDAARPFLDRDRSYPAAVDRLIAEVCPGWERLDRFDRVFSKFGGA